MSASNLFRRLAPLVVALAVVPFHATEARADPSSEEQALADVRFREGRELLDQQRYDDACAKFEESDRLWPRGGTALNLAGCREKQGKPAAAWAAYTRALGLAQKEGRADREELAKNKIAELQGQLSWLVVQVPPELDVPGAVITRDSVPIGRGAWGVPIPVDPGRHVIVANVPGQPPIEAVVDVGPRGDRRSVTIPRSGASPHLLPTPTSVSPSNAIPNGLPYPSPQGPAEMGQRGVVRLHVETENPPNVHLYMTPAMGGFVFGGHPICTAPCDTVVDGRDGQLLYFDGEGISRSPTFFVSDRQADVTVRVSTGSAALGSAGSTLALFGTLGAITGLSLLFTGAIIKGNENTASDSRTGATLITASGISLGVGGGVLAAGIVMVIAGRTTVKVDDPKGAAKSGFSPRLTPNGVAIAF